MAINKVSFTKTPQAKDDYYSWLEDDLIGSSFYNTTTGYLTLDVMANDLGGAAKSLYSIDDGAGNPLNPTDLLSADGLVNGVSAWQLTASGNYARINNGKIEVDLNPELGAAGVDGLGAGDQFTDTFVYAIRLGNGTLSWAYVHIDITGANDGASISGDDSGDVKEDDTLTASGQLVVSDVDIGEAELQPLAAGTAGDNGYGSFEVLADGSWTYTLDNAHGDVQALPEGATLFDTITVTSEDGTDTQVITVTITGTNGAATIAGDADGDVKEDDTLTASGVLTIADEDTGEAELQPLAAGTAGDNGYGSFEVLADGSWTYTLDNAHGDVQALPEGATLFDTITVTSEDGTDTQVITVTITGTNGAATIAGDADGDVKEDDTLTASGVLTIADEDTGEAELQPLAAGTAGDNGYGSFEVLADGSWTYTLDNAHGDVQALPEGATLFDTITVTSEDGTDTQVITVTITGTNGAATIAGDADGDVKEDDTLTASGVLTIADEDTGEAELQPLAAGTAGDNGYGSFEVLADGSWTYTLDNAHGDVQALPEGATLFDTITVTSEDGTDTQVITVTITGTNGAATIAGDADGDVKEDDTLTASGVLTIADEDTGEAELQPLAAGTAGDNGYGSFEVLADGSWTYTLDNAHGDVQALPEGATLFDTITVTSEDGTDTQVITVTITGTNGAATIAGDADGDVKEDDTLTASGVLTIADEDTGEAELQPLAAGTAGDNGYGSFEVLADGSWTYTLDNAHGDVQALPEGATLFDTITVTSEDGTDTQVITVTITGTNGAATIAGDADGDVKEDDTLTASGVLTIADEDTGEAELQPLAAGTAGDNGYGSFEVLADGSWTYTLDNAHGDVQALPEGATLFDTITVTSEDGTDTQVITVTITGTNGAATIAGDADGDVKEDDTLTASGVLTIADEDTGEAELQPLAAGTAGDNGYGSFEVLADGSWTYTLDNALAAVQNLNVGQTLQDSITVTSADGSDTKVITITIAGTSDLPVLPPVFTGGGDANDFDVLLGVATGGFTLVTGDNNANNIDFNGNSNEIINALGGNDTVTAGSGTDQIYGGTGNDNLNGEAGIDRVYGQSGNDTLAGDANDDSLYGGSNDDLISGNAGNDVIFGGSGADTIDGGANDDEISGGYGADALTGGAGADDFNFSHVNDTGDTITAFLQGVDQVDLSALFGGVLGNAGNTTTVAANSVNWFQNGADTVITVDVTGDATADLAITLANFTASTLTAGDFIL